jgi:hypothetical protein
LELKNELVKSFQNFLFNNPIEVFEHKLALHFYKLSINQIALNYCYTDWLVSWIREVSEKQGLDGLESKMVNSLDEMQLIYNLFRVLSFIQPYKDKGERILIYGDPYYTISFPLEDLVTHLHMDKKNPRYLKRVSKIFKQFVRLDPIIENFSDIHFRALDC